MSEPIFGNLWHGKLTAGGLVLADNSVKTSTTADLADGSTQVVPYLAPSGIYGSTNYYKVPGLPVPTTPTELAAIGGELKNDFVLFGGTRRYSPFNGTMICNGDMQWLHYGSDGKWRRLTLTIVSPSVIRIHRGYYVCRLNEPQVHENTLLAQLSLPGKAVSGAQLSGVDVRYDGRQVVLYLSGRWANMIDPASLSGFPEAQPWDNNGQSAIATAWRLDVDADCTTVTATEIWRAADPTGNTTFDRSIYIGTGNVFAVNTTQPGNTTDRWHIYEDLVGVHQTSYDSTFDCERLIGVAFKSDGTLHLIKYRYSNVRTGVWTELSCSILRDVVYGPTPTMPPSIGTVYTSPMSANDINAAHVTHPAAITYDIKVESNGVVQKTLAAPPAPTVYSLALTNNVFELRNSGQSICRLGPGAIDDTPMVMSDSPFASYNPRTGTVHTSETQIGFV